MSKEYLEALEKELNLMQQQKDNLLHKQSRAKTDNETKYWQFRIEKFNEKINNFTNIKQALQRLEQIDNSKTSEALECLEKIIHNYDEEHYDEESIEEKIYIENHFKDFFEKELNTIKQSLIKAQEQEKEIDRLENQCLDILADNIKLKTKLQEQEKALKIIVEKDIDFGLLKRSENWLDYYTRFKHRTGKNTEITEEEFDLLKRWKNEIQNK